MQNLRAFQRLIWQWPTDTFFRRKHGPRWAWWILLFPVPAAVLSFCAGSFLTSWLFYWAYWATVTVFQVTDRTMIAALRGQLRNWEARRRETRRTDAACMICLHVTDSPAYACPGCNQLHYDVMPSDLGTFNRWCGGCGAKFPTRPSRAAWHAQARCKRTECHQPLPEGAGAVRDIRVPVFGDMAAGKTRFLYASLTACCSTLTARTSSTTTSTTSPGTRRNAG